MALQVFTPYSAHVLSDIPRSIAKGHHKGGILTWAMKDGGFVHVTKRGGWEAAAVLRTRPTEYGFDVSIELRPSKLDRDEVIAVYFCRFQQMLQSHYRSLITHCVNNFQLERERGDVDNRVVVRLPRPKPEPKLALTARAALAYSRELLSIMEAEAARRRR